MNRRRKTTTPTITEQENITVTAEPDTTTDLLAAVPIDLQTDDLRREVTRAAQAATLRQVVTDSATAAQAAIQTALDANDVDSAITAATTANAVALVAEHLPSTTIDPSVVSDAMARAADAVGIAERSLPVLPVSDYAAELTAWRGMNGAAQREIDPPVMLPGDRAALDAADEVRSARVRLIANVATWRADLHRSPDPVSHLASAGGLIDAIQTHAGVTVHAAEVVNTANEARIAAGVTWSAPNLIPSFVATV